MKKPQAALHIKHKTFPSQQHFSEHRVHPQAGDIRNELCKNHHFPLLTAKPAGLKTNGIHLPENVLAFPAHALGEVETYHAGGRKSPDH